MSPPIPPRNVALPPAETMDRALFTRFEPTGTTPLTAVYDL
ncbi:MAG: hypothetical protein R3253_11500 [Longimicrobiales bacterium]|nr:hypothetical protein [Longimicrobiales bacterium]